MFDKIKEKISSLLNSEEKISFDSKPSVQSNYFQEAPNLKEKDYLEAFNNIGWVYGVVSAVAEDVSTLEYKLYQLKPNDDIERVDRHESLDVLNHVNDFMTKTDLLKLHTIYMMTTGKSFWYIDREAGRPKAIYILRPDLMNVVPNKDMRDGLIKEYKYGPKESEIVFEPEEIIYFNDPNPMDIRDGTGMLQPAANAADSVKFAQDWNRNFFYNNAMPDSLLTIKGNLNEEQQERLRKDWENKFAGTKKQSRLAILQGEAQYQELGLKQKDMQFLEGMQWSRDEIMALGKVPRSVLGITDDVNRANAEATEWIFAKRTIKPRMEAIMDQLNKSFIMEYGDDLFLDYDDPTPEDRIAKADYYDKAVNKWQTINEAREEMGLDPIDGGDTLYVSASEMPVGDNDKQFIKLKAKRKPRISDYAKKHIKTLKEVKGSDELKEKIAKHLDKEVNKYEYKFNSEDGKTKYWKVKTTIDEQYEDRIEEESQKIMKEQEADIMGRVQQQKAPERKKDIDDWMFDKDKYKKMYEAIFLPILTNLMREVGTNTLRFMGYDMTLNTARHRIQKFLKRNIPKMANTVVDTQYDRLYKALKAGVDEGEGAQLLAKRVNDEFKDLKRYQSERIARTEVLKASNKATIEAYRETNVVVGKEWLTARDATVCDWCDPMDGKTIPDSIDKNFFNKGDEYEVDGQTMNFDYDSVDGPPLHPNCRCTTIPVVEGDVVPDDKVWDREQEAKSQEESNIKSEIKDQLKKLKEIDIEKILGDKIEKLADKELKELREIKQKVDEQIEKDKKPTG